METIENISDERIDKLVNFIKDFKYTKLEDDIIEMIENSKEELEHEKIIEVLNKVIKIYEKN